MIRVEPHFSKSWGFGGSWMLFLPGKFFGILGWEVKNAQKIQFIVRGGSDAGCKFIKNEIISGCLTLPILNPSKNLCEIPFPPASPSWIKWEEGTWEILGGFWREFFCSGNEDFFEDFLMIFDDF